MKKTKKVKEKIIRIYQALTSLVFIILATGTIFYHFVENFTWLDSLYFSVITLTTVGYGDLAPTTQIGKIFTIFYIIIGIGIIFAFIKTITDKELK